MRTRSMAILAGAAALVAVTAAGARAGSTPEAKASEPAAQVALITPRALSTAPREVLTGNLGASRSLMLGFEVGGRLEKVKARKGERVKAGQVLAALNVEVIEAQVLQAASGVKAAEAQAAIALDAAGRQEELQKAGSVSELQSRAATLQAQAAAAQVQVAKAALAQAQAARRKHELVAPFDATVIDAPEHAGAIVGPGTPLFVLEQLDPLLLKLTVAEASRTQLRAGDRVRVEAVAGRGVTEDAVIRLVLPSADPQSRRIPVEILVPNADARFAANTLARATLTLGEPAPAAALPSTALSSVGGDHVFVVDGSVARRVPVRVLERGPQEVVVRADAPLGRVVAHPGLDLRDGATVQVR
ncbi:MAG: efflux RND transporter periplasmic adaptor subunit [Myxococcales bacterium]